MKSSNEHKLCHLFELPMKRLIFTVVFIFQRLLVEWISNARKSKMYGHYCRFNSKGGEAEKCPNSIGSSTAYEFSKNRTF